MNKKLKLIRKTKAKVKKLSEKQDKLYKNLTNVLDIKDNNDLKDKLFDYVYNDTCWVWKELNEKFNDERKTKNGWL